MTPEFTRPSKVLSPYIAYFFALDAPPPGRGEAPHEVTVHPVPHAQMVFSFGDDAFERVMGGPLAPSPGYAITGYMTRTLTYSSPGRLGVVMAGFHPWGLAPFLTMRVKDAQDTNVELKEVFSGVQALEGEIRGAKNTSERIAAIEAFLLQRLRRPALDETIVEACRQLMEERGESTVTAMAKRSRLSTRQFQRRFLDRVGIEPKSFAQLVRFQSVFEQMDARPGPPDWAAIAASVGYYDQSHFVRAFRAFTGHSPRAYGARVRRSPVGKSFDGNVSSGDPLRRMYV